MAEDSTPPPISGWMEARGVVIETTPNGDLVLMGEAANQESLAGKSRAARSTRRRAPGCSIGGWRRCFPNSPLAAEAAWRAADILWQIQKADASSRPSAHENAALPARPDG